MSQFKALFGVCAGLLAGSVSAQGALLQIQDIPAGQIFTVNAAETLLVGDVSGPNYNVNYGVTGELKNNGYVLLNGDVGVAGVLRNSGLMQINSNIWVTYGSKVDNKIVNEKKWRDDILRLF